MFCSKCGSQMPENSKFCANCGTPADQSSRRVAEPRTASASGTAEYMAPTDASRSARNVDTYLYETKNIGVCILFAFITFGIYSVYWLYTICKKIKLLNGEAPSCAGELCLNLFAPIYGYYWMHTRSKKLFAAAGRYGITVSDNSVANLLLSIFGLGIVAYAIIQNDLNVVARTLGAAGYAAPASAPQHPGEPASGYAAAPASASRADKKSLAVLCLFVGTILALVMEYICSLNITSYWAGEVFFVAMIFASRFMIAVGLLSAIIALALHKLLRGKLYIISAIAAGIFVGLVTFFVCVPILKALRTDEYVLEYAAVSVRQYSLAAPAVTLSMSLGLLLLKKGRRACYFIVKAISVALFLGIFYIGVVRAGLGFSVLSITFSVLISEITAAALFWIFTRRRTELVSASGANDA